MALYIVKPWYKKEEPPIPALIYGAEWSGGSSPVWTRTDAAANFADPNPYYAGMSGTPGSPFDNIMPWSGLRRVTDSSAGELVEIPKFYYKWTRDGAKMKLQISADQFDGALVSPAHADRGDGVGERDYVYVGRYQCASDYTSITGVKPKVEITRAAARSGIHNLGANIWQLDYATYWTINMLYLVEYAHWNSQLKIGYGCGNNSSTENSGASDIMPYHTGTMQSARNIYGVGIQYRYLENLWANVREWRDGIYMNGNNVYCTLNPANFSDTTGGTFTGTRAVFNGYITAFNQPSASGYEYALYPSTADDTQSGSTYITDYIYYNSTGVVYHCGGDFTNYELYGLFHGDAYHDVSRKSIGIGTRLMILPPNRLSA